MPIARVWIEQGCIRCSACAYTAPQVFRLPDNSDAVIIGAARVDGVESTNLAERSLLGEDVGLECEDRIRDAADGCPVSIIRFEDTGAQFAHASGSSAGARPER
jgi:ferredoxin